MIAKPSNWTELKEAGGDFPRLTPGGYVGIIRKVNDNEKDQFIEIAHSMDKTDYGQYLASLGEDI